MNNIIKPLLLLLSWIIINVSADNVVATYDGNKEITDDEITKWIKQSTGGRMPEDKKLFSQLNENIKSEILKKYVLQKELMDVAAASGIQKSKEFEQHLEDAKNNLIIQLYLDKYVNKRINNSVLKEQYRELVKTLKSSDDLEVSHILVADESTANTVYKQLQKGKSFGELAAKYSKDESSKNHQGRYGKVSKGQVLPQYEEAAYKLKKDQYSKPVQTEMGWFIIKLDDRTKKTIPSFDEVKSQLEMMAREKIMQEYFEKLVENAKIKLK